MSIYMPLCGNQSGKLQELLLFAIILTKQNGRHLLSTERAKRFLIHRREREGKRGF